MLKVISGSEDTTRNIAKKFASVLSEGDVVCLYGNLGAGKTVFASGLAEGLEISDTISSPTFTILHEYNGRLPLYHFDVYRINSDEFLGMGGDEYLYGAGISLVEWPENISDILPSEKFEIRIDYPEANTDNINIREISFSAQGQRYIEKVDILRDMLKT